MLKKSYVSPMILVQDFRLNENIASCEEIISYEDLQFMPNNADFGICDNACSYLNIEAWLGTLVS